MPRVTQEKKKLKLETWNKNWKSFPKIEFNKKKERKQNQVMMIVSDYAIGDASENMISISLLSRGCQAHPTINLTCIPVCFSSYTAWVLVTFFYRDGV